MIFSKARNYLFFGLLLVVTIFFLTLLKPFAYALFWAAVIATLVHPFYVGLNKRVRHPTVSTLFTLLLVIIIIIIPLLIIGALLITESVTIYNKLNNNWSAINDTVTHVLTAIKNNSFLARLHIDDNAITTFISDTTQTAIKLLYKIAVAIPQNFLTFLGMFLLMLYSLFYFIRDGQMLLRKIMYLFPFGDRYEVLLYRKFTATASATIKGTILVGGLQGLLGGLLFALTGIESAAIWGIVMAALSVIPVTGSFIVWLPAGVIMLLTGHIWQGILILAIGTILISTIDNIVRPMLVGKDLQIHPVIILFSTLGGLLFFNVSGFIIGPIVAALFLSLWEIYEEYYRVALKKN